MLKQVFLRQSCDNLFPKCKTPTDYWTKEDIDELLSKKEESEVRELFQSIIETLDQRIQEDGANADKVQKFVEILASKLYDKDIELVEKLYVKVMDIDLSPSALKNSDGSSPKLMNS